MIGEYIGNYRLTRLIGEGGMGMVYQAVHDGVGGLAAIKILRPEVAQKKDATTRLFNEARAANSIPHPGIVRIFDCGYTSQGVAYLAMEYLAGESLRARIDRERSLTSSDALHIARQIASVLQAAHSRQVVHRDLKPDNIMLVPDPELPGGERVKLLDFGVAKLAETLNAEPIMTRSDTLMGTPTYMAPEQCRGAKHVTDRSDVYSLGVILYQMLAGVPPFTGETVGELIAMHLADSEPPLASLVPDLSPEIGTLVHSMLRKKPADRPSVDEVAQELKRILFTLSQAAGMSPIQARRMVSETAIALLPPLSPEAQAMLRGNTAPPTLASGDSGPSRSPQPTSPSASASASGTASPAQSAGVSQSTMGRVPGEARRSSSRLPAAVRGDDPALLSTWDGEAVSRFLPPGPSQSSTDAVHPLAVTDRRIEAPTALHPQVAAAGPGPVVPSDPEKTPPIASVTPAKLASSDTPKRGELAPASVPSTAAATQTSVAPHGSRAGLPWFLGAGLLIVGAALIGSLLRSGPSPVGTGTGADLGAVAKGSGLPTDKPIAGPGPGQSSMSPLSTSGNPAPIGPRPDPSFDPKPPLQPTEPATPGTQSKDSPGDDSADKTAHHPSGPKTDSKTDAKGDAKKVAAASDAAQNAALTALRAKQYAEAQQQAQACVDKQPTNHRCWWMLGVAACQRGNQAVSDQARARLLALAKPSLSKEVSRACSGGDSGAASLSLGSFRLRDDREEWLNTASGWFESGRYQQAQALAEKNIAQSPADAWSMIGRSACALGDEQKANQSLSKVNDRVVRSDIVHYCIGKGFAYSIASGNLSKRSK